MDGASARQNGESMEGSDIRRSTTARRIFLSGPILLAVALPTASHAASTGSKPGPPQVSTGIVGHVRGSSAELQGAINPRGSETTYYFLYGPTTTYGSQTPPATLPAGFTKVKVGRTVTGLQPGYHYRLAATSALSLRGLPALGRDRIFTTKTTRLLFILPKPSAPTVFGTPLTVSGTLSGLGGANHGIVLQASAFPFLEPFSSIGVPQVTNAAGRFSFHVGVLLKSTQFRVNTLDPRPLYSREVTEHIAVRVTFKVRSAGRQGFVRLYGTVAPAEVGARVSFQLQKPARPGRSEKASERTVKFANEASTVVKKGTRTLSRFSSVVSIRHGGRYRAFVTVHPGPLVSGFSQTIVIHAAPAVTRKARGKKH